MPATWNLEKLARFQQRQLQEKEQRLLQLCDQQQQRAHQVAQRGSAGAELKQPGKPAQERRRREARGVDKSCPLEPLRQGKAKRHSSECRALYRESTMERRPDRPYEINIDEVIDTEAMERNRMLAKFDPTDVAARRTTSSAENGSKSGGGDDDDDDDDDDDSRRPEEKKGPTGSSSLVGASRSGSTGGGSNSSRPAAKAKPPVGGGAAKNPGADGESLVLCKICKRRFASERVAKHEQICAKTTQKKRKQFDTVTHRVKGTELESFVHHKPPKKQQQQQSKQKPPEAPSGSSKSNWRRKHEDFINAIRSAKQMQAHLAAGGKLSDLPPPPPSDTSDYVQCPHCSRKFSQGAAERHIPKCATMQHNKPASIIRSRR